VSAISIKRTHAMSVADAKKIADKVATKLEKDYQLKANWVGDVLNFARSGVNGTLVVSSKDFKIDVKLGFLMAAFKDPIQGAIEENLDKMLKSGAEKIATVKPASKAKK
jgi:putative polyhydroxyalkanoate system protein